MPSYSSELHLILIPLLGPAVPPAFQDFLSLNYGFNIIFQWVWIYLSTFTRPKGGCTDKDQETSPVGLYIPHWHHWFPLSIHPSFLPPLKRTTPSFLVSPYAVSLKFMVSICHPLQLYWCNWHITVKSEVYSHGLLHVCVGEWLLFVTRMHWGVITD